MRETGVRVSALRRTFGANTVLDGVDLEIAPGEFVALLGRSGSGKTTLLRTLAGLEAPSAGRVVVPDRRAVAFQDARLLPWKRVWENVALGLPPSDARRRAHEALDEVGLAARRDAWPATLSGGEAQRVALARALVRAPELLLLDEPFAALDALTRLRMHLLVGELWRRHDPAVLLVTHDVDEAVLLADRVLVLEYGRIAHTFTIDLPRPRESAQRRFAHHRRTLLAALGVELPNPTFEQIVAGSF
ncbi:MAG TPA: ABC transporter ATP-binding protein [Candidatus Limnocylindria bacterium]|jgi:sulfonate transport system ATP-binding protein|nr:ABC transporter ATP-binding protein [Candidatus Limnocylindria bacterium]